MKEEISKHTISRRSFLTGLTAVGAITAVGAVTGCSQPKSNSTAVAETTAATTWRSAPAAPTTDQIKETVDVDVCVVGGGSAGLGAGRSALLHGASSVLVLEKNKASRVGGGVHGVLRSKWTKEVGWDPTPEKVDEMIKEEIQMSSMRANERYYRVWAERSEEIFNSIVEVIDISKVHVTNDGNAPYDQAADEYFSEAIYPTGHQVSGGDVNTPVIEGLTKWISENGGKIRYSCSGKQLIQDKSGKVIGVYAENSDGTIVQINAKAVIIAAGGFEGNPEMVAELAPHAIGTNVANTVPGDGSGISMAVWAGAQTQYSPCCIMMSSAKSPEDPNVPHPIPFITVNKLGKRFANEATSSFVLPYSFLNQPDKKVWQIFDANYAQTINDLKIQTWQGTIVFTEEKIKKFESVAVKADTLEELATQLGIDPEGLKKTTEKYTKMVANGHDDQFGVPHRFMQAVNPVKAPFYGMEVPYNCLVSLGGITCDPDTMEVLDANREAIPGLYAAGNTVGERFGMAYTNNTTGLSNGFGDVNGFIAGESAGAYIA